MFQSPLKIISWDDFRRCCKFRINGYCNAPLKRQGDAIICDEYDQRNETMLNCPMWPRLKNFYTRAMKLRIRDDSPVRSRNGRYFRTEEFEKECQVD